jgi:nucleoside-diphosphate-sugar epimerase/glycosyltransferase involved in cell wall biosynthesis
MMKLEDKIQRLHGPILVLGASGFVGAHLFRILLSHRSDVYGTVFHLPAWRLDGVSPTHIIQADLLVDANLDLILDRVKPKTIFHCTAYGAYPFETQSQLVYETNFTLLTHLLPRLLPMNLSAYVHAGSSSEYGDQSAGPLERALPAPNSDYAVSKVAAANLLSYYGRKKDFPCANLRLYSIYGPLEDSSRLIPNLIRHGIEGRFPNLVDPDVSRDFVYIEDACEAFFDTALQLTPTHYGESFNIGSGIKTSIETAAKVTGELFRISEPPRFQTMENRRWDLAEWFSDPRAAKEHLGWEAKTPFHEGLRLTAEWYRSLPDKEAYHLSSKKFGLDQRHSVSAIVACYKDGQAIPIMYERLLEVFSRLKVDYEIIFVNDNSPDDSEAAILEISRRDRRVIGLSHSRNFGSQSAFRSGMEVASKNSCVLLDGDLQDPPELIESFVEQWRTGYDVVYGRRVKRKAPFYMQWAYKLFYRVFEKFSYLPIPRDAGDFSLLDRKVVQAILRFPERDFFLRGIRAFVGFKQTGVDYVRPERRFGVTTNSLLKNIGWAKKGLLSFSYVPLNLLSFGGTILFFLSVALGLFQLFMRLLYPELAPRGAASIILLVIIFGSFNLFALAILGEYIEKIFEEVKRRPHFVRRSVIRNGESRETSTDRIHGQD